jgi:hypothetical protein
MSYVSGNDAEKLSVAPSNVAKAWTSALVSSGTGAKPKSTARCAIFRLQAHLPFDLLIPSLMEL